MSTKFYMGDAVDHWAKGIYNEGLLSAEIYPQKRLYHWELNILRNLVYIVTNFHLPEKKLF